MNDFFSHAAEKNIYMMQILTQKAKSISLSTSSLYHKNGQKRMSFAFTRPALPARWAILFLFHIQRCVDD